MSKILMNTEIKKSGHNCFEVVIEGESAAYIAKEGEDVYLDIAHGEVSISDVEMILTAMKSLKN